MWQKHGRIYNRTINYNTEHADKATYLLDALSAHLTTLKGQTINGFTISDFDFFAYTDPITHECTTQQGILIFLGKQAEIMIRPSGTTSSGATIKVYLHRHLKEYTLSQEEALNTLTECAQQILNVQEYLGSHFTQEIT